MGLPQHPTEQSTNSTPSASSSGISNKASELPPAALQLATKLFDYAREGKTVELSQYISAGIPPNLTNGKGDTLLMLAAYHGHADTVQLLLEKGANPNTLNDRGQSPLAGAVFKGSDDVVKVLFEQGKADIYHGQPNAVDSAVMFKKEDYLSLFGVRREPGSGMPWEGRS
ncbi:ankyrin repeat-containing domain protein [Delphinella strobiligena]|nr:ankyrin repeat-containing domain protein [Delphinella strobiligena]